MRTRSRGWGRVLWGAWLTAPVCLAAWGARAWAAGDPPPPANPAGALDDSIILELGEIKVPAATILRREDSLVALRKSQDPKFVATPVQLQQLRRQLAMQELEFALTRNFAAAHKLTLTPEESAARLEQIKGQLVQQKITYAQFLANIGQSDEEFRTNDSAMQALEKKFQKDVTEEEIKAYFAKASDEIELRRCSHILIMYKGAQQSEATRTKEEALRLANDLLAKLKGGGDFAKLAKEHSECPSRTQGGDLDFSARKQVMNPETGMPDNRAMVPEFSEKLYALEKIGSLSEIVETPYGYHLIKLTGLKGLDDYKERVRGELVQEKIDAFMQQQREQNATKLKVNEKLLGKMDAAAPATPRKETSKTADEEAP